jgi:pSer/pThr/pTyr-binding forkhead associated (FHA) protein
MSKVYTIGRESARKADILIDNSTISGVHAKIWFDESSGSFWIEDLESRNRTYIIREGSKKRVTSPKKVYSSDIIVLGRKQIPFSRFLESVNGGENRSRKESLKSTMNIERCRNCGSPKVIGQPCSKC